jgi:hypothetical protein
VSQLVVPTARPGTPKLVGDYYMIEGRSYARASSVVDALAPEDRLLELVRERGWEWWDEAGLAADLGTSVHAECEKLNRHLMAADAVLDGVRPSERPMVAYADGQLEGLGLLGPPGLAELGFGETCATTGRPLRPFVRSYARFALGETFEIADRTVAVERVVMAEQAVWSERYGYAGTLDALVLLTDGRLAVVDIKTSKRLSWPYRLQTSAYVQALKETFGIVADVRLIVHLPSKKDGEVLRVIPYAGGFAQKDDFTTFWGALRLYRYRHHYQRDWMM